MGKIGDTITLYDSEKERRKWYLKFQQFEDQLKGGNLLYTQDEIRQAVLNYLEAVGYTFDRPELISSVAYVLFRRCIELERRVIGRDSDVEELAIKGCLLLGHCEASDRETQRLRREVHYWQSGHADEVRKKRAGQKATKKRIAELKAENAELREELAVTDKILASRTEVLEAIPGCPLHGNQCVSWALEWVQARVEQERSTTS